MEVYHIQSLGTSLLVSSATSADPQHLRLVNGYCVPPLAKPRPVAIVTDKDQLLLCPKGIIIIIASHCLTTEASLLVEHRHRGRDRGQAKASRSTSRRRRLVLDVGLGPFGLFSLQSTTPTREPTRTSVTINPRSRPTQSIQTTYATNHRLSAVSPGCLHHIVGSGTVADSPPLLTTFFLPEAQTLAAPPFAWFQKWISTPYCPRRTPLLGLILPLLP